MKESIIKNAMSDGKVAVTLFCDPEVANEIFKVAREMSIEVIDAGQQQTVHKSANISGAYLRIAEIEKSLEQKTKTSKPNLNDRLKTFLSMEKKLK